MSRPSAYKGNDPYIFVSYCHKDDARVWAMIEGLQKRGMRVWYDAGIEWGNHWDEVIFEYLSGCACVVAFVTRDFLQSENCMDEISYAKDEKKGPFLIFLDDLELTGMMKYRYGRLQALNLHQFASADALLDNLVDTQILSACRSTAPQPAAQRTTPAAKPAPQQTVPVYQPSRPSDADLKAWYRKGEHHYYEKEYVEAVKWLRKAAEQGYVDAQWLLGFCYYHGQGVECDLTETVKWYRKAAEQGHIHSQYELGDCYFSARGVDRDLAEAVKWYRKAAEQGYRSAQYMLGLCYADGKGVAIDKAESVKWYRKAAEQGDVMSQHILGECYDKGIGVKKDKKEAVQWWRKAAQQGNRGSQRELKSRWLTW